MCSHNLGFLHIAPVVVCRNERALRVINSKIGIGQCVRDRYRRTESAHEQAAKFCRGGGKSTFRSERPSPIPAGPGASEQEFATTRLRFVPYWKEQPEAKEALWQQSIAICATRNTTVNPAS